MNPHSIPVLMHVAGRALIAVLFVLASAAVRPAVALEGGNGSGSSRPEQVFRQMNPCPATGKTSGSCKGYVIDYRIPLCKGGQNTVYNMYWLTAAAAKAKHKVECRQSYPIRR